MKYLAIIILTFFSFSSLNAKDSALGNLYSKWVKLSLSGKNQSEIEYFFRNIKPGIIESVKGRLRSAVLENLRRQGLKRKLAVSNDIDDLKIATDLILTEVRYAGLEHDSELRLSIKEEFGFYLESL